MSGAIEKTTLISLCYRYKYLCQKNFNIVFYKTDKIKLTLTLHQEKWKNIPLEEAARILHEKISKQETKINRKASKKGRGYVEKSVSKNAKDAYKRGLKPISKFRLSDLKDEKFQYSLRFFKWLIAHHIIPEELHHTSAAKKMTRFYGAKTIKKLNSAYDLNFLYKMYLEKLPMEWGLREKNIQYLRMRVLDTLIGGQSGRGIQLDCISYQELIFYSFSACFYRNDKRVQILEVFDQPPTDWNNKNTKALVQYLLRYKPQMVRWLFRKNQR